ncbi:hypothetical protein HDV57DRAFT_401228 [Trichoderma longibrachiatum]|uniref:Uncharacterized protein n=1 Tax=Trichoderma longibrachiatum ATCC 18648 TaxID=983965 RepID=A0A2T4C1R2_TRILO|nr:hypothetical protein M440DRAFT_1255915 [Trichoderma longibrachiatum ATCC 18648]
MRDPFTRVVDCRCGTTYIQALSSFVGDQHASPRCLAKMAGRAPGSSNLMRPQSTMSIEWLDVRCLPRRQYQPKDGSRGSTSCNDNDNEQVPLPGQGQRMQPPFCAFVVHLFHLAATPATRLATSRPANRNGQWRLHPFPLFPTRFSYPVTWRTNYGGAPLTWLYCSKYRFHWHQGFSTYDVPLLRATLSAAESLLTVLWCLPPPSCRGDIVTTSSDSTYVAIVLVLLALHLHLAAPQCGAQSSFTCRLPNLQRERRG